MAKFTDLQRRMWTFLSYTTVCRFYIEREKNGEFVIKKAGYVRLAMYYMIWTNSITKVTYLFLTYQGWLKEVDFLGQMSIWDWWLCFSQVVQETNIWYRKYPLYEVLHANWKLQEDIFQKLGSPRRLEQKIMKNDYQLIVMHIMIVVVGVGALAVQFFTMPKYPLNTYAVVPFDHWILRILFACHECLYMFHCWVHQASSVVLCEVFAVTYTNIIQEMTQVMLKLSEQGLIRDPGNVEKYLWKTAGQLKTKKAPSGNPPRVVEKGKVRRFLPDRNINPSAIVPGTEYDILGLIQDYKNVMLAGKEFNSWVGKLMAGTNMSNYGQFISDVFMMIQLLKEPEMDLMGVMFYFADACAGMLMLFRMLILMSRVYPASEGFLHAFKGYLQHETPKRRYLLKYEKTLRIVAAKIGGHSTKPGTVPLGVNCLINYYIAAAMWKRPVDRLT